MSLNQEGLVYTTNIEEISAGIGARASVHSAETITKAVEPERS
jgi:hypothetical protein